MSHLIAPSILAANFGKLDKDCELVNNSKADWFHIDVMDGVFVPNISFGMPVIKSIKKIAQKPMDVHLMIVEPDRYIKDFKKCGSITKPCGSIHYALKYIKSKYLRHRVSSYICEH